MEADEFDVELGAQELSGLCVCLQEGRGEAALKEGDEGAGAVVAENHHAVGEVVSLRCAEEAAHTGRGFALDLLEARRQGANAPFACIGWVEAKEASVTVD